MEGMERMQIGVQRKRLIATAVGAALIVPAVVLAGGGPSGSFSIGPNVGRLKFSSSGGAIQTRSKTFKTIPGMSLPNPDEFYKRPVTVQISADMTSGKAKFRVIADEFSGPNPTRSNAPLTPASVTFTSPGSNSFEFVEPGANVETGKDYDVQWRQAGNRRAKAANVVMTLFGAPD
jgi:hypothetical protein